MNSNLALNKPDDNAEVILENVISLKKFPPILRKLGKHLLENEPMSFTQACSELDLNRDSVYTVMNRSRRKGYDFQAFINQESMSILHRSKIGVFSALVKGAVSCTPQATSDRKLYFQLTGDLKESTSLNINHLTIGVNVQGVQVQEDRDKGVIDVQPLIPKGK